MSAAVLVRAPATSANLGPGFDALGLALDLHDEVEAEAEFDGAGSALSVDVEGECAQTLPRDERHLVVRAMRAAFDETGRQPSALRVRCRNTLPHGRGLGSSAAAIVAGVVAARTLAGAELDRSEAALRLASRLEGHPDNVAPCLLGGLTVAWTDAAGHARAVRADVHPGVTPVVCVPTTVVPTKTARALLPETVPHAAAAANAGRAALLVEALTRRPDVLLDATEDQLHQQYREPAMPATLALMRSLREQGLPTVVSGAGPSVLVLAADPGQAADIKGIVPPGWDVRELVVQTSGVVVNPA